MEHDPEIYARVRFFLSQKGEGNKSLLKCVHVETKKKFRLIHNITYANVKLNMLKIYVSIV